MMNMFHLCGKFREALAQPFKVAKIGMASKHEHGQVQHHAHRHFPQQGVHVPVDHCMPEAVRAADVEHECKHCHGVADQADKRGGAGNGLIAFQAEQVDTGTQTECTRARAMDERSMVIHKPHGTRSVRLVIPNPFQKTRMPAASALSRMRPRKVKPEHPGSLILRKANLVRRFFNMLRLLS